MSVQKHFDFWNVGVLLGLCLYQWVTLENPENIVFWPGAYFISLGILSTFLKFFHINRASSFHLSGTNFFRGVVFGILHFVTTGILILLLERLFQFEEHYTLTQVNLYVLDSWHYGTDGFLLYFVYLFIFSYFGITEKRRMGERTNRELRSLLHQADLSVLKTELNPHFIYNAMNSLAMKIRLNENKVAVEMIASISTLLRSILKHRNQEKIRLSEELDLLNKFIDIEKMRFGEHVNIHRRFSDEVLDAMVPEMIFQPLLENAFKHGIREGIEQQKVEISAEKQDRKLILHVSNSSVDPDHSVTESTGIGLPNVMERLRRLYGTAFRIQMVREHSGFMIRLTIPFQRS